MSTDKAKIYQDLILNFFLESEKELVTIQEISEKVQISDKTIRNRIEHINDYLHDENLGEICRKPRVGIWLNATNEQKVKLGRMISENSNVENNKLPGDRFSQGLKYILKYSDNHPITTQQLADILYLSVPTTLKIVKEVEEWLSQFNIELKIIRNVGICLDGTEVSRRLAIKHCIMRFHRNEEEQIEALEFFTPGLSIAYVRSIIIDTEVEWNFEFTDESFTEILIYLSVAIYRNQVQAKSQIQFEEVERNRLYMYTEYSFSEAIYKRLFEAGQMEYIEEEIAFLSVQILCSKLIETNYAENSEELLQRYDNKLYEFVCKVVEVVSSVLNVDLTEDETLINGLLLHIRPVIFRLRFERSHSNKLTNIIKNEYKQTFRVAWLISVLFEEYYGLQVTVDEISYLAIYIQSALERQQKLVDAVLVTQYGMGMSQLLIEKIKQSCPFVREIKVMSFHDFDLSSIEKSKLILTTAEIDSKDPRVIEIDYFLTDNKVAKINKEIRYSMQNIETVETKFDSICHSLFDPDLVFAKVEVNNKEEILTFLCKKLDEKGYVTSEYIHTVLEREEKTSTSIDNMVCIPHGNQEYINESKVVIATLKKPILWDSTDKINVVCLLAVKMNSNFEIQKTQLFYKQFVKLVDTEDQMDKIRNYKNQIDLYKYLVQ